MYHQDQELQPLQKCKNMYRIFISVMFFTNSLLAEMVLFDADMLVILNDNAMSISENVGGLASYFARILSSRFYLNVRQGGKKILSHLPSAQNFARKTEEHMKGMVVP